MKDIAKPTPKPVSGFKFSARSKLALTGVDANLVKVITRALELSPVDFMVIEGLRTEARQRELVAKGASKTMQSKHLTGKAVDIVPIIDGQVRWDWPAFYPLAVAVREAAKELNVKVRWGGVWDKPINDLSTDMAQEIKDYCVRHKGPDFLDGPHYEII